MLMGSLPFCWATIHRVRCPHGPYFKTMTGYPEVPKTIGDQIRKRRLDLGIRQIDAAKIIGCNEMSVVNWEKGHSNPRINHMAGVIQFLGFNPIRNGNTVAHRLIDHRKALGMTQREFAGRIGVNQSTLARWERGEREPKGKHAEAIKMNVSTFDWMKLEVVGSAHV